MVLFGTISPFCAFPKRPLKEIIAELKDAHKTVLNKIINEYNEIDKQRKQLKSENMYKIGEDFKYVCQKGYMAKTMNRS